MIDLTIEDDIARVVLNAPEKRNSLDLGALQELAAAYSEAEAAGVRALLLTGEGRVFCAGRDISAVDPATDDAEGYLTGTLLPLMQQMSSFPAPTFAAVQGACLGVGLGLAIATDVVYVAQDAKIGSPFAALGAILDSGGHALFTERLGAHRTLDLIYTGEMMSGAEAVTAGLFSRAVPTEELAEFTEERVRRGPVGLHGQRECGAGRPDRHRRLPRGLQGLPGEAQADLHGQGLTPQSPLPGDCVCSASAEIGYHFCVCSVDAAAGRTWASPAPVPASAFTP